MLVHGEWTFQPRVDFRVHSLHARGRPRIGPDATAENQTVIHFGLTGAQRGCGLTDRRSSVKKLLSFVRFLMFPSLLEEITGHGMPVECSKLTCFAKIHLFAGRAVKLSSERGEKEVLADSNQPTAPPSTKSHVSYCAARARRREKMAAEGTSSTTG